MARPEISSAVLFVPGRGSYVTSNEDGTFGLNLTQVATNRSEVAADVFDESLHSQALFSGGYPGIAQPWPEEQIPPLGNREADLLARPLEARLRSEGWNDERIAERVKKQGESISSFGDVLVCVKKGLLDPDDFHGPDRHGIDLDAGWLHASRIRMILVKALVIDPKLIRGIGVRDHYGYPATEFQAGASAAGRIATEVAAVAMTKWVLRGVPAGNLDALFAAEEHFNALAAKTYPA
jgi:hypothetical protein